MPGLAGTEERYIKRLQIFVGFSQIFLRKRGEKHSLGFLSFRQEFDYIPANGGPFDVPVAGVDHFVRFEARNPLYFENGVAAAWRFLVEGKQVADRWRDNRVFPGNLVVCHSTDGFHGVFSQSRGYFLGYRRLFRNDQSHKVKFRHYLYIKPVCRLTRLKRKRIQSNAYLLR